MKSETEKSYDSVASDYAKNFQNELADKPFDRKIIEWLAERVGDWGAVCDLGCGPGQVAAYLYEKGVKSCGIDLSSEMVKEARRLNPEVEFFRGDMLNLEGVADNSFGGLRLFIRSFTFLWNR